MAEAPRTPHAYPRAATTPLSLKRGAFVALLPQGIHRQISDNWWMGGVFAPKSLIPEQNPFSELVDLPPVGPRLPPVGRFFPPVHFLHFSRFFFSLTLYLFEKRERNKAWNELSAQNPIHQLDRVQEMASTSWTKSKWLTGGWGVSGGIVKTRTCDPSTSSPTSQKHNWWMVFSK